MILPALTFRQFRREYFYIIFCLFNLQCVQIRLNEHKMCWECRECHIVILHLYRMKHLRGDKIQYHMAII